MAMTQEPERGTDEEAAGTPAAPDASGANLERRNFFRTFSREAFQTAATVVGAASAVRKGSTAAAVELLGLGVDPEAGADRLAAAMVHDSIGGRSPYRVDGDRILVLDQRRLPGEIVEAVCISGAEVAGLIRDGAVGPGPVLGPLAAYALVLTADRNVASRPFVRSATLRGTANALRNARPDSAALDMALNRVAAAWEAARGEPASEDADTHMGAAIAAAVRAEADAIATEAMVALTRLVEHGVAVLPQPVDRPLEVVTIGATGPLSAGLVGTAMGIFAAVAAAGRPIHAWVLEARPGRTGARIGAAELAASDVPATVIADGAMGWLFRGRTIDAVLVGADWIAANGDVANVTGTFPLAALAVRHGVPVYVCAPRLTVSERKVTGDALSVIMRGRDQLALPGEIAEQGIDARVPLADVTPAELVTAYITDVGVLQAPFTSVAAPMSAPEDTRLMATTASRTGELGERLQVRQVGDRVLLRAFLERDRLFAAYAICDLDDREFHRTRWGGAFDGDRLIALAMEYVGFAPQPLFVMGEPDGVTAILRTVIRPRAAYVASLSSQPARGRASLPPGGQPADGPHVGRSGQLPAAARRRLPHPALGDRRPQSALQPRLHGLAVVGRGRQRHLLRHPHRRSAGGGGGHPRHQP